jgi:hypothetical protein
MLGYWWKAIVCFSLVGCGGGDDGDGRKPESVPLTGTTACERYASLASGIGCEPLRGCMLEAACENLAVAWVNCAAKDPSQCLCESDDGDLNCEGSFKANEGPASCTAEYQAFDACSAN